MLPGLRVVGNGQYSLKAFEAARITWEKIRDIYPNDLEANDRLATIYQRLAENEMSSNSTAGKELLNQSDQAISRLLRSYLTLEKRKRAEVYSLKARNTKHRWIDNWRSVAAGDLRKTALQSKFLVEAYQDYERAYHEDLNHFYSGVNALGLLTTLISLATSLPNDWLEEYDSNDEAELELKRYKEKHQRLSIVVQLSFEAEKKRLQREERTDPWVAITEADFYCLISTRPARVANLYRDAISQSNEQNFDAAKRQLKIYEDIGILPDNVKAALAEFTTAQQANTDKTSYLLFTGHMIDKADRAQPRFPPSKEPIVRAAIKAAVQKEKDKTSDPIKGIAGGATGGDIIFHEVCAELGIETELYLALPREKFMEESVEYAGTDWVERFNALYKKLPKYFLSQTKALPKWLQKKEDYSIWERNNLWMLNSALVCGGIQLTLIALWDGKGSDKPGGTNDMVVGAKGRGGKTVVIDLNKF